VAKKIQFREETPIAAVVKWVRKKAPAESAEVRVKALETLVSQLRKQVQNGVDQKKPVEHAILVGNTLFTLIALTIETGTDLVGCLNLIDIQDS